MVLSVVDLVAAVGLWMRVAWGKVVWLLAALFGIALHTVFVRTYGSDLPIVLLHVLTIGAFVVLTFFARRDGPAGASQGRNSVQFEPSR